MEQVFITVLQALSAVPELKYISEDWGQLNFDQGADKYPCALIDLVAITYKSLTDDMQRAETTMTIRLASIQQPDMNNDFSLLPIIDSIHEQLCKQVYQGISGLQRVEVKKVDRKDSIKEYVISYKFKFSD